MLVLQSCAYNGETVFYIITEKETNYVFMAIICVLIIHTQRIIDIVIAIDIVFSSFHQIPFTVREVSEVVSRGTKRKLKT